MGGLEVKAEVLLHRLSEDVLSRPLESGETPVTWRQALQCVSRGEDLSLPFQSGFVSPLCRRRAAEDGLEAMVAEMYEASLCFT